MELDATGQAALVARGDVSPLELVDAAIARCEQVDPVINAVIHRRFERAREEAAGPLPEGPLRGVPIVMKDTDGTSADDPYHAGTRFLADRGFVARTDSNLTARLRAAGAIIIGRTNTPELALQPTTEPELYGPTRNPWNPEHSTGGSSGGSAAAVAARIVAIGQAGDGGGSIRIPASECGLVGLKGSRGRVSVGPQVGEAWGGAVSRLALTRTVRDTALVLDVLGGTVPGDPYSAPDPRRPYVDELGGPTEPLRIGWTTDSPDPNIVVRPPCRRAVEATVRALGEAGHRVEQAHPSVWDDKTFLDGISAHFINLFATWTATEVADLERLVGDTATADDFEIGTWTIVEAGRAVTGVQYLEGINAMHAYGRRLARWWADGDGSGQGFDLLVTPTIPEPPPLLGEFHSDSSNPIAGLMRSAGLVPFCSPFNMSGQPAMSVPVHVEDGLPIGVQLVAAYGREDHLVAVAGHLEQVFAWADRRPAI